MQCSLSSLMRVLLTAEPHIEGMHGLSRGPKLNVKLFLYEGGGRWLNPYPQSFTNSSLPSFSVLPTISFNEGILHCEIIEGSFCTATFKHFVKDLLDHMEPFPYQYSVIVMDNCRIHKHPDIIEMIESRCVIKL